MAASRGAPWIHGCRDPPPPPAAGRAGAIGTQVWSLTYSYLFIFHKLTVKLKVNTGTLFDILCQSQERPI